MSEMYQRLAHSSWDCKYHVVFVPKRRSKVLFGQARRKLGKVFHAVAPQKECQIIEGVAGALLFRQPVPTENALRPEGQQLHFTHSPLEMKRERYRQLNCRKPPLPFRCVITTTAAMSKHFQFRVTRRRLDGN